MTAVSATMLALVLLASAFTVLVSTPPVDGCRSFQASPSAGPLTVEFRGQCDVEVRCEDLAVGWCE